jgi:twinkle protein
MNFIPLDLGNLDKWLEPPKIAGSVRPLADFADEIIDLLQSDPSTRGSALPWPKTRRLFRLRPHELTVWAGENGSWKSTILSQVLLDLAMHGCPVLLCSLEMTAREIGLRLTRQACCTAEPSPSAVKDFLNATRDRFQILDVQGRLRAHEAIALLRWAAVERGFKHIALDNLAKIVSASNDAAGEQQAFLSDAHGVALDTGAHVHIVAHVRKPAGDDKPGRYDIRGSSTISDQADNVVMTWRNRAKEAAREEGDHSRINEPDLVLTVAKQRNAEFEGAIKLWAHRQSMQFVQDGVTSPIPYAFEHGAPQ